MSDFFARCPICGVFPSDKCRGGLTGRYLSVKHVPLEGAVYPPLLAYDAMKKSHDLRLAEWEKKR